ncbi:MAG: hypothetical protein QNJ78_13485 [Gammaproteobacteria bacterium]|nr:hypothetical protein [Gammaproteobacteria bacterium]
MFRTLVSRSLTSSAAVTLIALALSSGNAFACKNNPFKSAQIEDDNLPLIASNETGKCGGDMGKEGKPGEAMQCGDGKCGGNMSTSGKPAAEGDTEGKKCGGDMSKEGKPSGSSMQCGAGKCGGN